MKGSCCLYLALYYIEIVGKKHLMKISKCKAVVVGYFERKRVKVLVLK